MTRPTRSPESSNQQFVASHNSNAETQSTLDLSQVRAIKPRPSRPRSRKRRGKKSEIRLADRLRQTESILSTNELRKGLKLLRSPEIVTSNKVEGADLKSRASSWGVSLLTHALVALCLAYILFPLPSKPTEILGEFSSEIGDQLDVITNDEGNLNPNDDPFYDLEIPEDVKIDDMIVFEDVEKKIVDNVDAAPFEQTRTDAVDNLSGRADPGLKNDLLAKYGGSQLTEKSVEAGLAWLAKQQQKDGSWSILGPYSNGVRSEVDNKPAATALALLAFQGAGNSRVKGKYAGAVRRGWTWLLKQQKPNGCFTPDQRVHEALFYTHALCTLALCEEIALEKKSNPTLRKSAQSALDYLIENQHKDLGGWKYDPQVGSDLSVTAWCVMALRTAEFAGLTVPKTTYDKVSSFLDSVSYDDGAGYVYQLDSKGRVPDSEKRPSMTAAGLLCREYLGWGPSVPALQRGAESLVQKDNLVRVPNNSENYSCNVYGWYVASTALKGLGPYNKHWRQWNASLSTELPKLQEPPKSKEEGSWSPAYDEYAFGGGRLYVTALSILSLEVYYRHLSFTP